LGTPYISVFTREHLTNEYMERFAEVQLAMREATHSPSSITDVWNAQSL
jgi:hypothetical protein